MGSIVGKPHSASRSSVSNLIFTVSNEGFLYVIEKNNGNIIRVTNLYKNYKEKKRANIKPIGFVIGKTNLYLFRFFQLHHFHLVEDCPT